MPTSVLAASHFPALDWVIVALYFVGTTILGAKLAGKQATIRDFFLGGRTLPWWAVALSIVSTEISAVTFVAVPAFVFAPGGDFTYWQHGLIGALLARLIVARVLVPAYYEREIYSPYDYMGQRLGPAVKKVVTGLFCLGGTLSQSARVYLTAVVLEVALGPEVFAPLEAYGIPSEVQSVTIITIVAVVWTLMGGMATVIWTDVLMFGVFVIGALVALFTVVAHLDGGFAELFRVGYDAGKFHLIDASTDVTKANTIWAATIASTLFMVGQFGTDQLMAQRIFCCRGPKEAGKAVVASWVGQGCTLIVLLVGVALYAYHRHHPLAGDSLAAYQKENTRLFPMFIVDVIPTGLTGLIIAGIFAAAISGLDSIYASLTQTTMAAFWQPLRRRKLGLRDDDPLPEAEDRKQLAVGRVLIVVFAALLAFIAIAMVDVAKESRSFLDFALQLAGYTSGALLAGFLLAFLPLKVDGFGFCFSAPLSVLTVFALLWHDAQPSFADALAHFDDPQVPWPTFSTIVLAGGTILVVAWIVANRTQRAFGWARLPYLLLGCAIAYCATRWGFFTRTDALGNVTHPSIPWPWQGPCGAAIAFTFGILLGRRKERT